MQTKGSRVAPACFDDTASGAGQAAADYGQVLADPEYRPWRFKWEDEALEREYMEFSRPGSAHGVSWRESKTLILVLVLALGTYIFIHHADLPVHHVCLTALLLLGHAIWAILTQKKRWGLLHRHGIPIDALTISITVIWILTTMMFAFDPGEVDLFEFAVDCGIIPVYPLVTIAIAVCTIMASVEHKLVTLAVITIFNYVGPVVMSESPNKHTPFVAIFMQLFLFDLVIKLERLQRGNFLHVKRLQNSDQVVAVARELEQLIEGANAPIIGIDRAGLINRWNAKTHKITGFSAQEAIGKHLVGCFIEQENRASVEEILTKALQGVDTANYELAFRTKTGHVRTLLLNASARRDVHNTITGVVGVAQDVTELIASKMSDAANKERADAERNMNEYLAHEVRNPLAVAIMGTELLVRKHDISPADRHLPQPQPPLQPKSDQLSNIDDLEQLKTISANLAFMLDLLSSMLDANKFMSGKLEISEIPIMDLKEAVIKPVHEMLQLRSAEVPVIIDCADGLSMMGDALRLKQVLVNLGTNAVKFTPAGYVMIRVAPLQEGKYNGEEGHITISVEDTGHGVPAEKQRLLFTKYQQLNSHVQGTGIGLYLCHALVKCMGGKIWLDQDYVPDDPEGLFGPGCSFVIKLPWTRVRPTPAQDLAGALGKTCSQDQPTMRRLVQRGVRMLIVDDNKIVLKTLSQQFRSITRGWTIDTAIHGEEAIMLLEKGNHYDLITMDHYMSESGGVMLGDQAIAALRRQGVQSIIVGSSGNDTSVSHLEAGADLFWRKPIPFKTGVCQYQLHELLLSRVGLPPTWTVLVADDQRLNRRLVRSKLRSLGAWASRWTMLEASSGREALDLFKEHELDLAVLDECMSDELKGSDVARLIRAQSNRTILVSVSGMDLQGADDQGIEGVFDVVWRKPVPPNHKMIAQLGKAWGIRAQETGEGWAANQ